MSTIGTAASYASDISALLSGSADTPSPASTSGASTSGTTGTTTDPTSNPATRVDLSDKIKDILARASTDQEVAKRLQAFVASRHAGNTDGNGQDASGNGQDTSSSSSSSSQSSTTNVDQAFQQLSGGTPAPDNDSLAPVQVGQNFATGLQADGYSISAVARASDGSFQVEIMGPDGKSFLDRRFGTSGEFSTFGGIQAGGSAQSYQQGNKEYITFSESVSAATSVSASSAAGSVSAVSSGTRTDSVTFAVDFQTGQISMTLADSLTLSTMAQVSQPGSTFSTVA